MIKTNQEPEHIKECNNEFISGSYFQYHDFTNNKEQENLEISQNFINTKYLKENFQNFASIELQNPIGISNPNTSDNITNDLLDKFDEDNSRSINEFPTRAPFSFKIPKISSSQNENKKNLLEERITKENKMNDLYYSGYSDETTKSTLYKDSFFLNNPFNKEHEINETNLHKIDNFEETENNLFTDKIFSPLENINEDDFHWKLFESIKINYYSEGEELETFKKNLENNVFHEKNLIKIDERTNLKMNEYSEREEIKKDEPDLNNPLYHHKINIDAKTNYEALNSLNHQLYLNNLMNLNPLLRSTQILSNLVYLENIKNLLINMPNQEQLPQRNTNFTHGRKSGWTCTFCNNFNYAIRIICNRCRKLPENPNNQCKMSIIPKNFNSKNDHINAYQELFKNAQAPKLMGAQSQKIPSYSSNPSNIDPCFDQHRNNFENYKDFYPKNFRHYNDYQNKNYNKNNYNDNEANLKNMHKKSSNSNLTSKKTEVKYNKSPNKSFSKNSRETIPNKFDINGPYINYLEHSMHNIEINNKFKTKNNEVNETISHFEDNEIKANHNDDIKCHPPQSYLNNLSHFNIPNINSNENLLLQINNRSQINNHYINEFNKILTSLNNSFINDLILKHNLGQNHYNANDSTIYNNHNVYCNLGTNKKNTVNNINSYNNNSNLGKFKNSNSKINENNKKTCEEENMNDVNNNLFTNNSSEKKRNKPFVERAGDWACIRCKNLNFSFRVTCNRCQLHKSISTINSEIKMNFSQIQNNDEFKKTFINNKFDHNFLQSQSS